MSKRTRYDSFKIYFVYLIACKLFLPKTKPIPYALYSSTASKHRRQRYMVRWETKAMEKPTNTYATLIAISGLFRPNLKTRNYIIFLEFL